ncbi:MAG: hypothetical protein GY847_01500 [Proteobacteria bacterium]|nr:hypothetical protein [Pseudomonadota bacterium]
MESNEEVNEEVNEEANEEVNEEANEEAMWNGRCLEVRCLDSRGDKGRGGTAFSAVRGLGGTEELGSSSQDPYAGVLGEKAVSNLVPRCDADLFPKGSGKRKAPPCPYEAIADLFREKLVPPLPEPNLDKEIKKIIRARWLSSPEMSSLDWWSAYFDFVGNCDFLMGRTSDFHASFFWLVGPKNLSKVMNGQYLDNRHKGVFSQAAVNTAINLRRFVNQMQGGEKK